MSLDEKTMKLCQVLARLRDGLQGLQPAIEEIDAYINFLGKPLEPQTNAYDVTKIPWVETEGQHGKYEKTDDVNNTDYKALRKDLVAHNGKLTHQGLFYWVFQNGVTIGRKKATYEKQSKQ